MLKGLAMDIFRTQCYRIITVVLNASLFPCYPAKITVSTKHLFNKYLICHQPQRPTIQT